MNKFMRVLNFGFVIAFAFVVLTIEGLGQVRTNHLEVNEACPNFEMKGIDGEVISLSTLRGKYFILDFWTIGCIACIGSFPEVNEIKKKFDDDIEIIHVGKEHKSRDAVAFYRKFREKYKLILKSSVDSNVFKQFVHSTVPLAVWVDKEGIVKAFTGDTEIKEENIRKFISGEIFPHKDLSYSSVLSRSKNSNDKQPESTDSKKLASVIFESKIEDWQVGDGDYFISSFSQDGKADSLFTIRRMDLNSLYRFAYFEGNEINVREYYPFPILNVKDSTLFRFRYTKMDDRRFNYSLLSQNVRIEKDIFFSHLREDLNRAFPYFIEVVETPMPCFELIVIDQAKLARSINKSELGKPEYTWLIESKLNKLNNIPVKNLASIFASLMPFPLKHLYYDKTNCDASISLEIEGDIDLLENIRRQLKPVGLDFILTKKDAKVLKISDL